MNSQKDINPSRFLIGFLRWFCRSDYLEELLGDLEEGFRRDVKSSGIRKARIKFSWEIVKLIRPTVIKRFSADQKYVPFWPLFNNYILFTWRNILRHRMFSFINIFSLSIAMSAGLLVIGMLSDLTQYDEFHRNRENIFRVVSSPVFGGYIFRDQATSPLPLGDEIIRQFPDLELTQLGRRLTGIAFANDKRLSISGIWADGNFFSFLSFNLLRGNPDNVLEDPFSVVITHSLAAKIFGDDEAVGQLLEVEGTGIFKITGIVEDPPKFSHIQFEVIGSLSTWAALAKQGEVSDAYAGWNEFDSFYNYLLIPEGSRLALGSWLNQAAPKFFTKPIEVKASFWLQRVDEVVPGPDLSDQIGPKMITLPLIILSSIALAILLSAIFNYTNLSMARALRRAMEVGIRKVNGASNRAIFFQFSMEAVILSLLSLGLGILLFVLIRPGFLQIIPRASELLRLELTGEMVLLFLTFAVFAGIIAGLSPALFFFRLSSLKALRYKTALRSLSGIGFRKALIVAQFTLSIMFVLAILIANRQYRYSLNHDMGFDRENILILPLLGNDPELLRNGLNALPEVSQITMVSHTPGTGTNDATLVVDERTNDSIWVSSIRADEHFLPVMNIDLIAGRNFRPGENDVRENAILVNETFVDQFGLGTPSEAVGKMIRYHDRSVEVIGVMRDFHHVNLEQKISSLIIRSKGAKNFACLKLTSEDVLGAVGKIERTWEALDPANPMEAEFYEDRVQDYYQFLVDIMKMFGFIAFLAISISCLGMFGMSIYLTEVRLKEIGIRKTFGATVNGLIVLLSRGFLQLILLAILIGVPICYIIFDQFILAQNYYRTDITMLEISLSILFLTLVCSLTIISQTWAAARTNPALILRNE